MNCFDELHRLAHLLLLPLPHHGLDPFQVVFFSSRIIAKQRELQVLTHAPVKHTLGTVGSVDQPNRHWNYSSDIAPFFRHLPIPCHRIPPEGKIDCILEQSIRCI